jgi:hypothetical protein
MTQIIFFSSTTSGATTGQQNRGFVPHLERT